MHIGFYRDALFCGMTSNAFKLGTALHLGWFWPRINGCSVLFRGTGIETVNFDNVFTVEDYNAEQIQPPAYLEHLPDSTYYYVLRRVNSAGDMELTLSASARVLIDSNGKLAELKPSSIFISKVQIIEGSKVKLVWFYCPLQQKSNPACFNIYTDDGTGQIDYENFLTQVPYQARRFYSFITDQLQSGKYLFAIRAEDSSGEEDKSFNTISVEITNNNPASIQFSQTQVL
ncbi:MAG: hypothetical protein JW804_08675 [Sedimentisphaerales bacterium]|nr:hypothetical protein [Sedimentisphaerales bacterium]